MSTRRRRALLPLRSMQQSATNWARCRRMRWHDGGDGGKYQRGLAAHHLPATGAGHPRCCSRCRCCCWCCLRLGQAVAWQTYALVAAGLQQGLRRGSRRSRRQGWQCRQRFAGARQHDAKQCFAWRRGRRKKKLAWKTACQSELQAMCWRVCGLPFEARCRQVWRLVVAALPRVRSTQSKTGGANWCGSEGNVVAEEREARPRNLGKA